MIERENVFYFRKINSIGGVESFFYYLSKLYKNFTILYESADSIQVQRLANNVEIRKWYGEKVKCKRFFGNYGLENIIPYLEAEEKYFIIHCDYRRNKLSSPLIYPDFKYIAVSKLAGISFKQMTGIPFELIYNPVALDKPKVAKKKDKIHIVCATRLSGEKGGWRIDKLSEELDKENLDYDLTIYTNKPKKIHFESPNVILKEPKLDLTKEMTEATFVLQLSDHEAFGLSVCESLCLGTPVIITDIPAFHEIGCNENNAIFLNLNMSNIQEAIRKIKKGIPPFKYTPPKSNWDKYLDNNSTYNPNDLIECEVIKRKFWDLETDKHYKRGDKFETSIKRKSYLEAKEIVR